MNDLNSVLIEGNLVRDTELRYIPNGTAVATLTVANNRYWKQEGNKHGNEVSFIEIVTWGKLATACDENLVKGRGVRVTGRLKQERWETEGEARSKVVIVAEHVEFKPVRKEAAA